MDVSDQATMREEQEREIVLRESRKPTGPTATGRCLHCDEILDDVRRWCDADCRDQWEALTKNRR